MTDAPLGWGLIGASDLAHTRMIPAIRAQPDCAVVAALSGQAGRAVELASAHTIPGVYGSLEALLAVRDAVRGGRRVAVAGTTAAV